MKTLALLLAAIVQPTQFDLICRTNDGEKHLRVDLTTKKWCDHDCIAINDIVEVQPGSIFFDKETAEEQIRNRLHFRAVNRITGEYWHVDTRYAVHITGSCEAGPFSGFPKFKTRF